MKNIILSTALMLAFFHITAQNLAPQTRRTPLTSDLFNGMPIVRPPSEVQGDVYFDTHWSMAAFNLYNASETLEGYYSRYNIHAYEFEIRTQQGTKGLSGDRVKNFTLKDSINGALRSFINAKDFKLDDTPLTGFFQVLSTGPALLVKRYYLLVKKPDYNPALNAGSRDTRIIRQSELFYVMGSQAHRVKSKKKLLASFGDKAAAMETYMQNNSLSTSEEDLRKIFNHYNELTAGN